MLGFFSQYSVALSINMDFSGQFYICLDSYFLTRYPVRRCWLIHFLIITWFTFCLQLELRSIWPETTFCLCAFSFKGYLLALVKQNSPKCTQYVEKQLQGVTFWIVNDFMGQTVWHSPACSSTPHLTSLLISRWKFCFCPISVRN